MIETFDLGGMPQGLEKYFLKQLVGARFLLRVSQPLPLWLMFTQPETLNLPSYLVFQGGPSLLGGQLQVCQGHL